MTNSLRALRLGLGLALISSAAAEAAPPAGRPVAWIEMTGAGAQARLVTPAGACPSIRIDGRQRPMAERAGPTPAFPGRVCQAALPEGVRQVSVGGLRLHAPKRRPDRLVILGDSGCRLKGLMVQSCNDPASWPFARIAALAAARRPDLVIHVGDYYYRETPCPAGDAGCAGSPYGDRWPSWKAELFDPAAPLLAAAPWVFARGNHEDCRRGGAGWFRLLDAGVEPKACPAASDTFAVDLGGATLFVVDSADTEDLKAPADRVAAFAQRLAPAARSEGPAWIVTHRPVWNAVRVGGLIADGLVNATERQAVRNLDLSRVDLIAAGHVHNFATLDFGSARPAQLVVGTGGDTLDVTASPPPAAGAARVDGLDADVFTMGRWGYLVLDRAGTDWLGRFYGLDDRVQATCRLHGRELSCRAA